MDIFHCRKLPGTGDALFRWSKTSDHAPLLAVAPPTGGVQLYTHEGRPLGAAQDMAVKSSRGNVPASQMAWSPAAPMVAIAWREKDDANLPRGLSLWNAATGRSEEDNKTHRRNVSLLSWSADGGRLLSADKGGTIVRWRVSATLVPEPVATHVEGGAQVVAAVFADDASGSIYYGLNHEGGSTSYIRAWHPNSPPITIQELDEPLHALFYYGERSQLLAVTDSCTLHLLAEGGGAAAVAAAAATGEAGAPGAPPAAGAWQSLMKMKFASPAGGTAAALHLCWLGHHTLASASEREPMVRLFNFDT